MGINHQVLEFIEREIDFRGKSVIEIGDQCIIPPLGVIHMSRDWYLSKGVDRYVSLDLNGNRGALQRDIRGDVSDLGQFDVVTNFGTLEHVEGGIDGQIEAFASLDSLCMIGGLFIHDIPLAEHYRGHSPILYQIGFLTYLAKDNGYEFLGSDARITNGCHTAILRKTREGDFMMSQRALSQLCEFIGEGVSGAYVCN